MPRITRVISSELIIARSGHATHDAERARHGGEYCDDYFEQGCPVELVHRVMGYRLWVIGYGLWVMGYWGSLSYEDGH